MKDGEALMLLLGLAAVAGGRRQTYPWGEGWVWPVPPLLLTSGGRTVRYNPVASDGYYSARPGEKPDGLHRGVDVVYKRRSALDAPEFKPGTPEGTKWFFAPRLTPIVAARDGRIWSVRKTGHGWSVVIDHGKPWTTWYQHIETPAHPVHAHGKSTVGGTVTHVKAGDVIGFMGYSPLDKQKFRHLHFATWFEGGDNGAAVDPERAMASWSFAHPWSLNA